MKNYKPDWSFPLLFRLKNYIFAFTLLIFCYKCAPALYIPSAPEAEKNKISLDSLIKGRELYINDCSSCHNLYLPERFTFQEWSYNVNKMQERAKIDDTRKEQILKYLQVKSKK